MYCCTFVCHPVRNLNLPEPRPLVPDPSSVADDTEPRVKAPPGLSFLAVERVSGKEFFEPEALEKVTRT